MITRRHLLKGTAAASVVAIWAPELRAQTGYAGLYGYEVRRANRAAAAAGEVSQIGASVFNTVEASAEAIAGRALTTIEQTALAAGLSSSATDILLSGAAVAAEVGGSATAAATAPAWGTIALGVTGFTLAGIGLDLVYNAATGGVAGTSTLSGDAKCRQAASDANTQLQTYITKNQLTDPFYTQETYSTAVQNNTCYVCDNTGNFVSGRTIGNLFCNSNGYSEGSTYDNTVNYPSMDDFFNSLQPASLTVPLSAASLAALASAIWAGTSGVPGYSGPAFSPSNPVTENDVSNGENKSGQSRPNVSNLLDAAADLTSPGLTTPSAPGSGVVPFGSTPGSLASPGTTAMTPTQTQTTTNSSSSPSATGSSGTSTGSSTSPSGSTSTSTQNGTSTTNVTTQGGTATTTTNGNTTNVNVNLDLGTAPNNPTPTLPTPPTGKSILQPLMDAIPKIQVNVPPGQCPRPSLWFFDKPVDGGVLCDFVKPYEGTVAGIAKSAWTLVSSFYMVKA